MGVGSKQSFVDAVRAESAGRCVGRAREKALLGELLEAQQSRAVLLLGPGGIGKSTLLHWLAARARAGGGAVGWVSGEQISPNPDTFLDRVRVARPDGEPASLADLGRGPERDLLVVDSFELLMPLARWLIAELLAELGPSLLVVLASRERLPAIERARLGLDAFVELEVAPLGRADAGELLALAGVAEAQREALLDLAEGHPLALRLAAERARPDEPFRPQDRAHVIEELVRALASKAPTPRHARALQAASVAQTLDEALLAAMLGADDVRDELDWLSRSALMEPTALGVSPHALAREALFTDLKRRDPELLVAMQRRLVDALVPRMLTRDLSAAYDIGLQAVYAHRDKSAHYGPARTSRDFSVVPLAEAPLSPIREAIRRHEGEAGLASFDLWRARKTYSTAIVHDEGHVTALQVVLPIPFDARDEHLTDPLIRATWELWRARGASRGQELHYFRWFLDLERYQELTPAIGSLFPLGPLMLIPRMHEVDALAFANSPPEVWVPLAPAFQLEHPEGAVTAFGERRYAHVFGSQRAMAGAHWGRPDVVLRTLHDFWCRQFGLPLGSPSTKPAARDASPPPLTREELGKALTGFLAELQGPAALSDNPISIALRDRGLATDRAARLELVGRCIDTLAAAPRSERSAEVLRATYFSGSAKQLAAAADLGVPFGTYRYQLRKAVDALAAELWHRLAAG